MARSPDTTRKLNRVAGSALAGMISLVRRTSRVVYEPADALLAARRRPSPHRRHLARPVHDDVGLPALAGDQSRRHGRAPWRRRADRCGHGQLRRRAHSRRRRRRPQEGPRRCLRAPPSRARSEGRLLARHDRRRAAGTGPPRRYRHRHDRAALRPPDRAVRRRHLALSRAQYLEPDDDQSAGLEARLCRRRSDLGAARRRRSRARVRARSRSSGRSTRQPRAPTRSSAPT